MRYAIALVIIVILAVAAGLNSQTHQIASTSFGELYEDNASGTTINITDATTDYPWVSTTVGESRNMTLSAATDNITIVEAGTYFVSCQISYAGSNSTIYTWSVHKNDSPLTGFKVRRTIGTGTDIGSASISGIVVLAADDTLNLEVQADGASKVATVYFAQLNALLLQ
jgi:hypothetical protein